MVVKSCTKQMLEFRCDFLNMCIITSKLPQDARPFEVETTGVANFHKQSWESIYLISVRSPLYRRHRIMAAEKNLFEQVSQANETAGVFFDSIDRLKKAACTTAPLVKSSHKAVVFGGRSWNLHVVVRDR